MGRNAALVFAIALVAIMQVTFASPSHVQVQGGQVLLSFWSYIKSLFLRLFQMLTGSLSTTTVNATTSVLNGTASNVTTTTHPVTICSLPNIPVGCTWISTANSVAPCAGYVSCPSNSTTTVPQTTTIQQTNSSSNSSGSWPQYPIKVISVNASNLSVGSNLTFSVTLENTGATPVSYEGGCYSPLSFNVTPSDALTFTHEVQCDAIAILYLQPGATVTLSAPVGSRATIAQPGPATVNFVFKSSNSTTSFSQKFNFTST